MADSFYERDGDRYRATELTRGPWDPDAQHAGPPAALLAGALEACEADREMQVAKVSYEILQPVPIGALELRARVVRPGRRVQYLEGALLADGEELMRAAAWRIRTGTLELGDDDRAADAPPPGPEQGEQVEFFPTGSEVGYHTAIDARFVEGSFRAAGPAVAWLRLRHPLVDDEPPSPLQRVLAAADSGNGISAALDYRRYVFINTDLTVHLHRLPAGEWVGLDSRTRPEPSGIGLTDTTLYDERGRLGSAAQTLLVAER